MLHPISFGRLSALAKQPRQTALISGPVNSGKMNAAMWLAEEVVGPRWSNKLILISPSDKGSIALEEVHKIRSLGQYKSNDSSDRKVVIIDDAHAMTLEAQNSFLKLLEEPPEDLYLILLSWQPKKLLETIRSRLVEVTIQQPTLEQILQEFDQESPELIKKLYLMTNGSAGLIKELLTDREHPYSANIAAAKTLIGQSSYERLIRMDEMTKDKQKTDELLAGVLIILESVLSNSAAQGKSIKSVLPKIEATIAARTALRKNYNTKLTLSLLFTSL